jgi:diguanylate cyclase (GGDEF)-like protein
VSAVLAVPVPGVRAGTPPAAVRERALLGLVLVFGVAGAATFVAALTSVLVRGELRTASLLLVLLTTVLTDATAIDLRIGRHAESFTWSELSIVLGLALLPPDQLVLTTVAIGVAYLATGQSLVKWTVNVGAYAVGVGLSALLSRAVTTPAWERPGASAAALLLGAVFWACWNKLTIVTAISLAQGRPLLTVLRSELVSSVVVACCNIGLAFGFLALASGHRAVLWSAPACIVLAGVLNRCYLRLVQDRAAWRELEQASRELTALDEQVLVTTALRRVTALMQSDGAELRLAAGDQHRVHRLRDGEERPESVWSSQRAGATVTVARTEGAPWLPVECTEASVPLDGPGGPLGLLVVQYDGAVRLSRRERSQLAAYAGALSVALCNARLHEELREQAERHAHAAQHDPLTGLPNRMQLHARLGDALAAGDGVSVLLLDLDRFKPVNDTHGHGAGDEVLRIVAGRLRAAVRPADLVARLGGDEFAVLVCEGSDSAQLAERLQALVAAPIALGQVVLTVGASIGRACSPDDGTSPEALLRAADDDMYRAKRTAVGAAAGSRRLVDLRAGG